MKYWIWLSEIPYIGAVTAKKLITSFIWQHGKRIDAS